MATISARVDEWLKRDLEKFWRAHGDGPSTGLRYVAEEWWTLHHFPGVLFL